MSDEINVKNVEQNVFKAAQQDGLIEIFAGICLASFAILVNGYYWPVFLLPIILMGPVLRRLRNRITFPRTGYVQVPREDPGKLAGSIFGVMIILLLVQTAILYFFTGLRSFDQWFAWLPSVLGILMAGMFISMGAKSGSKIHYLFAVFSIISGFLLSVIEFNSIKTGLIIYFLVNGFLFFDFGVILLARFLKKYPLQAAETPENCI